jgi:hypothetical protein
MVTRTGAESRSIEDARTCTNENPRRITPARVSLIYFTSYFLQHLPGQHFALPLQQSAANVAGVVPMNAAKVAIRRRYFIESSF